MASLSKVSGCTCATNYIFDTIHPVQWYGTLGRSDTWTRRRWRRGGEGERRGGGEGESRRRRREGRIGEWRGGEGGGDWGLILYLDNVVKESTVLVQEKVFHNELLVVPDHVGRVPGNHNSSLTLVVSGLLLLLLLVIPYSCSTAATILPMQDLYLK